jgi:hypothetical protein
MSATILRFRPNPAGRDTRGKHTGKPVCLHFPRKPERKNDYNNDYSITDFFPPAA